MEGHPFCVYADVTQHARCSAASMGCQSSLPWHPIYMVRLLDFVDCKRRSGQ